jgi:hypothetical protein
LTRTIHTNPSQDTFSTVLPMIDPKAADAPFGPILADVLATRQTH